MGITIGDVLTVVAIITGICISVWALLIGAALLSAERARAAQMHLETAPWKGLIVGAAVTVIGVVAAAMLWANPVTRLASLAIFAALIVTAIIGGSGLALLVAGRIEELDPDNSPFKALGRAAALLIMTGLLPLFGWFFVTPLLILISVGAGFQALLRRRHRHPATEAALQTDPQTLP